MSADRFMDEQGRWKCIQCGACCRVVGVIPEWDRGDGMCQNLTRDNLCSIYEVRPEICRTACFPVPDAVRAEACSSLYDLFAEAS